MVFFKKEKKNERVQRMGSIHFFWLCYQRERHHTGNVPRKDPHAIMQQSPTGSLYYMQHRSSKFYFQLCSHWRYFINNFYNIIPPLCYQLLPMFWITDIEVLDGGLSYCIMGCRVISQYYVSVSYWQTLQ